jgi:aminoglycoside phosphotransferase family enzyme
MTAQSRGNIAATAEAEGQEQVLAFLDGSSFGAANGGKRIDTHASMVFLRDDRALKIKRPFVCPFSTIRRWRNAGALARRN